MREDVSIGDVFGRLTVCDTINFPDLSFMFFVCKCACGTKRGFTRRALKLEKVESCGCLHRETARKQGLKNKTHGAKIDGNTLPEYRTWAGLKNRCLNTRDKAYYRYGGRGIKVCDEWKDDFSAFLKHVGKRPGVRYSLDRINNDGNYEPGNVRWATAKQQANNRRPPIRPSHI